ncbi:MAG TPA: CBS domain-containing protein, partial [Acidimicrobiales bacterium]|nr:CBS domain-containing protein [Acidimicrobiales bacterium]
QVRDLWIRPALVLGPRTTLSDTAAALRARDVSAAVVGHAGAPIAVVTERDLTRAVADGTGPHAAVGELATDDPVTVAPTTTVLDAATTMLRTGVRHLVVAERRRVVGIVSMRDLLAALVTASTTPHEVHPTRFAVERRQP